MTKVQKFNNSPYAKVIHRQRTRYFDSTIRLTTVCMHTGWPKKTCFILYLLTSATTDQFSNLFHCQNQVKLCNNTITEDPKTSVTTHFKKLTTRNNVFTV